MKTIKKTNPRTGKSYAIQITNELGRKEAEKQLEEKMEYDYRQTLTPKERAELKYKETDFNCPFCKEKTEVITRKEKMTSGFLFVVSYFVDVFTCQKCGNEFTDEELNFERKRANEENDYILLNELKIEKLDN